MKTHPCYIIIDNSIYERYAFTIKTIYIYGGIMIKARTRLLCALLAFVTVLSGLAFPSAVFASAASGGLHSIAELNRETDAIDSHSTETALSTLELDYRRSYKIDNDEMISSGSMWYPRIKRLADGTYILFFQDGRYGGNVFYTRSADAKNWDTPSKLYSSHLTYNNTYMRNYANCDAIQLKDGTLLTAAIFHAVKKDESSASPSRFLMSEKGIVLRRSSDGGRSWSEQEVLYNGRCWEPSFLQLPDGTVQLYFTQSAPKDAVYKTEMGNNVSSGVGMITSSDGGKSWAPRVLTYPYVTRNIAAQPIYEENGITMMTDQMPVAVLLHDNETILMTAESLLPDKSSHSVSIIRSHDFFSTHLEENEYGPEDRDDFAVTGASPYIALFPSGETVLSAFAWLRHNLYIGNSLGTEFNFDRIFDPMPHQEVAMWGDLFVADAHTLLTSAGDTIVDENETTNLNSTGIGVSTIILNHRIDAKTAAVTVDGYTSDWDDNTDALFVGSVSQAQSSIRAAHDASNIYLLAEVMDNNINSSDTVAVYLAADGADIAYRLTVTASGSVKLQKISASGSVTTVSGASAKIKLYGTKDNTSDTDSGYVIEAQIPASLFGSANTLRTFVKLTNKDGSTKYDADIFDGTTESDKSTWHKIFLSGAVCDTAPGSSDTTPAPAWDGVSASIDWYVKNTGASEFFISTPAQLYGLSVLCGHFEKVVSVNGDSKIYYDSNCNVIFDKSGITSSTASVAATKFAGKKIRLCADIDLGGHPFLPIGSTGSFQAAIFDGNSHKIKNLYVTPATAQHKTQPKQYYYGLFAATASSCLVQDLTLENLRFDLTVPAAATSVYTGGIVAYLAGTSRLCDCTVDGLGINYDPAAGFTPTGVMIGAAVGKYESTQKQANIHVYGFELSNPQSLDNYTISDSKLYGKIVKSGITASFAYSHVTDKAQPRIREEWDGVTANIGWYAKNTSESTFMIRTAEELYGLSVLTGHYEKAASVKGDSRVYYDEEYNVILDASLITEQTPYVAATKLDAKTVKLNANIDLAGKAFLPIGTTGSFKGAVFDGQGCTVSNFTVSSEQAAHKTVIGQYYYGFFATIAASCKVRNLNLENITLNIDTPAAGKSIYAGGITAYAASGTSIRDCSVNGVTVNYASKATAPTGVMIGAVIGKLETSANSNNIVCLGYDFYDTASLGNYTTHSSLIYGKAASSSIKPSFTNCSVTRAMRADYGDYNADGSITNADLTLLIRYLSGHRIEHAVFDITSDKKVSNRDAIRIINLLTDPHMP